MPFISCQKLAVVLEILTFLCFLVLYKNSLMRTLWLISTFMTSQTGQQIIAIQILPNILRGKGKRRQ